MNALALGMMLLAPATRTIAQDAPAANRDSVAGARAGERASVNGPRWGAAAATFFLTPVVGGVGSLVVAARRPAVPAAGGAPTEEYRRGYLAAYTPRRRHAMQQSVLWTSVIFVAGVVALSDR